MNTKHIHYLAFKASISFSFPVQFFEELMISGKLFDTFISEYIKVFC